jgi:hypothetical protein
MPKAGNSSSIIRATEQKHGPCSVFILKLPVLGSFLGLLRYGKKGSKYPFL